MEQNTTFAALLAGYLRELDINAAALAKASGLSRSVISRYLSGAQLPAPDGRSVRKLAAGIAALSAGGKGEHTAREVEASMLRILTGAEQEPGHLAENLRTLLDILSVTGTELAAALSFAPSHISRILAGTRRPGDLPGFLDAASGFLASRVRTEQGEELAEVLSADPGRLPEGPDLTAAIRRFLVSDGQNENRHVTGFLVNLNTFDLNDYIRSIGFDEIKVPTAPFQIPTTKTYRGVSEMMKAEIDFLRAAVLSRSRKDIILYSDMPMEEMAKDPDFPQKWAGGIALLLRKGLALHNIHDVHRPFGEMMLGLTNWIPLYMTGQITSYYFPQPTGQTFSHILRSAGTCALSGEAVAGHQGEGRYIVTKQKEEVAYYRQRAKELLRLARPLIRTFPAERARDFRKTRQQMFDSPGRMRCILSVPPLATMSEEVLTAILERHGAAPALRQRLLTEREITGEGLRRFLDRGGASLTLEVPGYERDEFHDAPPLLALSEVFEEQPFAYSEEEYLAHLADTAAFAERHPAMTFTQSRDASFRNIQIRVKEGEAALLSKGGSPCIHFFIEHPKMVDSLFRFRFTSL